MGKKKTEPKILTDHKRTGKKFVPPMRQLGDFQFTNWQSHVLPELLWIAELIHGTDICRAAELSAAVARFAQQAYASQSHVWFAAASAYDLLRPNQKKAVVGYLQETGTLDDVKAHLSTIVAYYPRFPLRFLYGDEAVARPGDTELQLFKRRVGSLLDRSGRVATFTQAHAIAIAFRLNMLQVAPDISLANFPAIENYPDTEESIKIAASVRALITGFTGFHQQSHKAMWPLQFWNRGFELEGCEFHDAS